MSQDLAELVSIACLSLQTANNIFFFNTIQVEAYCLWLIRNPVIWTWVGFGLPTSHLILPHSFT